MKFAIYCGASIGNKEIYKIETFKLGQWIGRNGHELVYGGSDAGLMGILADA